MIGPKYEAMSCCLSYNYEIICNLWLLIIVRIEMYTQVLNPKNNYNNNNSKYVTLFKLKLLWRRLTFNCTATPSHNANYKSFKTVIGKFTVSKLC